MREMISGIVVAMLLALGQSINWVGGWPVA